VPEVKRIRSKSISAAGLGYAWLGSRLVGQPFGADLEIAHSFSYETFLLVPAHSLP
jgi:hypothetical protein